MFFIFYLDFAIKSKTKYLNYFVSVALKICIYYENNKQCYFLEATIDFILKRPRFKIVKFYVNFKLYLYSRLE